MYLGIRGDLTSRSRSEHERTLEFLKDHFGNRRLLGKITPLEARRFVAWYRQRKHRDRSPATATVNKLVRECRRIFREAVECSLIRENPFHQIRQERVGQAPWHYVSPEEFRKLTAASPSLRWRGMITLAYCCGLRISEILNLTWADVDFERSHLRVIAKRGSEGRAAWTPKDKDARVVPTSKDSVDVLTELHLKALPGHQYVFVNSKGPAAGGRVKRQNTWREFGAIRRKAKLPKFTFHDLRRSFCTNLAGAVPLHVVQELAGHSDIRTTRKHYLQVRQELIETAREALDRVMQR
ncbi:MAG: tyrosine-type recombinase/integrase [Planctomycetota bacterium]